ncbi:unnamed protein product [Vitrella brassicaformis CCMP3155]|uniref:beta-galactosidase n=2 Tax=Vitrella brassicaformis TaxID=1169539 RepID=A0A0G4FCC5_VITBC|nr:unnamed protein product [Vitrella brassicaformis CCMP3155]|eukprot:CEM10807.1 unnamed protein product [Vitrella brassicaformis CCMP3155]
MLIALIYISAAAASAALEDSSAGFIRYSQLNGSPYTVTYNSSSLLIDGRPSLILSAGIHYPRASAGEWDRIFRYIKAAGFNAIQSYVFWNIHEPIEGQFDFTGRRNLTLFLHKAAEHDLFVVLRPGPYVCAEWTYGGIPVWLRAVEGMAFRQYNELWMGYMTKYMRWIMQLVEPSLPRNGGNIIVAQVENEYGYQSEKMPDGHKYVEYCADLANSLETDVPWIMCKQDDAPPSVIHTCNGNDCWKWIPHQCGADGQPCMWTEHWVQWFRKWGEVQRYITPDVVTYRDLRWFASGGVHRNYYQSFGGSNFGRTAAQSITTSYDYGAALDEYGFPREPLYSHVKTMQLVLATYSHVLTTQAPPVPTRLDQNDTSVVAFDWGPVAFLVNENGPTISRTVPWKGHSVSLRGQSVVIVDEEGDILFDSAELPSPHTLASVPLAGAKRSFTSSSIAFRRDPTLAYTEDFSECVLPLLPSYFSSQPTEQLTLTNDTTDYLWYIHRVSEGAMASGGTQLAIPAHRHWLMVFVDGVLVAARKSGGNGGSVIELQRPPQKTIALLSSTLGLVNFGAYQERWHAGIYGGAVKLDGRPLEGWEHCPGVGGETLQLWDDPLQHSDGWRDTKSAGVDVSAWRDVPIVWYKAEIDIDEAIDMDGTKYYLTLFDEDGHGGLLKGSAFVNGHALGRYWNITSQGSDWPVGSSSVKADIVQEARRRRSLSSGPREGGPDPSRLQTYHVPPDWLVEGKNTLVVFEEIGGDPRSVTITRRRVTGDRMGFIRHGGREAAIYA